MLFQAPLAYDVLYPLKQAVSFAISILLMYSLCGGDIWLFPLVLTAPPPPPPPPPPPQCDQQSGINQGNSRPGKTWKSQEFYERLCKIEIMRINFILCIFCKLWSEKWIKCRYQIVSQGYVILIIIIICNPVKLENIDFYELGILLLEDSASSPQGFTHWDLSRMFLILKTIFRCVFLQKIFLFKSYWGMSLGVQLAVDQHWFGQFLVHQDSLPEQVMTQFTGNQQPSVCQPTIWCQLNHKRFKCAFW